MDRLLEVNGLSKSLDGQIVLGACHFSLAPGHITGLLGPNGAGKSTLLRTIAGLLRPDGGEILLHGRPIGRRERPRVAYMADQTQLPHDLTVRRAIRWYRDLFPDLDLDRFQAVSGSLPERELVSRLSKGQAERLDLGLLLARDADLYLLDEPLGGVDPVERAKILSAAAGVGVYVLSLTVTLLCKSGKKGHRATLSGAVGSVLAACILGGFLLQVAPLGLLGLGCILAGLPLSIWLLARKVE